MDGFGKRTAGGDVTRNPTTREAAYSRFPILDDDAAGRRYINKKLYAIGIVIAGLLVQVAISFSTAKTTFSHVTPAIERDPFIRPEFAEHILEQAGVIESHTAKSERRRAKSEFIRADDGKIHAIVRRYPDGTSEKLTFYYNSDRNISQYLLIDRDGKEFDRSSKRQ